MEGLGAEVTQKIKSAIQAKLMELNAYVDDELPDYVMVMVGNKRSKTQMENDLQLFLGSNTVPFTSWLYQVLQKLQEVTVASKSNAAVKPKRRDRTPSIEEDEDCINIKAETDGDFIEEDVSPKARKPERTGRSKSDRAKSLEKEKPIEYLPSKIKDRKHTTEDINERKVEKVSKETNTVNRKRVSNRDELNLKKSSNLESSVTSTNREESVSKDDIRKKRSSCSPTKDKLSDKVMYDARELLNRKKAEKLASKDLSAKQRSDQVKRKRDRTPEDRHSKRVVTHSDSDVISHRLSAPKDGERERNGRDKDSALKSTIHRTTLKRKMLEDDRNEDRSDRWKEDKRTDNSRSNKVIRISETVQAEQEILKPRTSNKTVTSGHDRKSVHSRIAPSKETNRDTERDRERDRDRDRDAGVSSIVRITPRPKRPASQQPSSSLILKAVAEANKSLAAAPARPLPPTSRNLERPLRGKISPDKITVTLPNHRVQPVSKDEINSHNAYSNDADNGRKQQRLKEINEEEEEEENGKIDESDLLSGSHEKDGIALSCTNASYSTNSHVTTTSDKATAVDKEADEAINQWLRGVEESNPLKPLPDSFSSQETDLDSEPVLEICQNMSELEPEEEPEFVVTLHGLDPGMFPKVNENDDEEDEDFNYSKDEDEDNMEMENLNHHHHRHNVFNNNKKEIELNADSEELMFDPTDELIENRKTSSPILSSSDASPEKSKRTSSPIIIVKQNNNNNSVNNSSNNNLQGSAGDISDGVKLKSLERCKYWPNCLLGDKCSYHHPSSMCKTFPACKYGDTCLFVHPTCKFGMSCTRRDCLYMHGAAGTPKVKVNQTPGALQYCRFYPNCSNVNCQFYHPKPCRFGRYCTKKDCLFEHKKGPTKDKLKWTRTPTSAAM